MYMGVRALPLLTYLKPTDQTIWTPFTLSSSDAGFSSILLGREPPTF